MPSSWNDNASLETTLNYTVRLKGEKELTIDVFPEYFRRIIHQERRDKQTFNESGKSQQRITCRDHKNGRSHPINHTNEQSNMICHQPPFQAVQQKSSREVPGLTSFRFAKPGNWWCMLSQIFKHCIESPLSGLSIDIHPDLHFSFTTQDARVSKSALEGLA